LLFGKKSTRALKESNITLPQRRIFSLSPTAAVRIYAGILSFICAEALTGASLYWVINPFSYLVSFPVYLTHILFFYSLAHHCGRRSLKDIYLFGILFALYESWITKVLWAGYPSEDGFILGPFLGHGIHETIVLILYFHPVVAFIFPLVVMGILFPTLRAEIGLQNSFWGTKRLYHVLFWFSFAALAFGPSQVFTSALHPLLHWVPTLLVVYGGYWLTRRQIAKYPDAPPRLELSVRGTKIMGGVILASYIITYPLLLPERIPALWVQCVTLLLYAGTIALIIRLKRDDPPDTSAPPVSPKRLFGYLAAMSLATTLVFAVRLVAPQVVFGTAAIGFLLMMVAGCILFWAWVLKDLFKKEARP
jgi:hypothetical protein